MGGEEFPPPPPPYAPTRAQGRGRFSSFLPPLTCARTCVQERRKEEDEGTEILFPSCSHTRACEERWRCEERERERSAREREREGERKAEREERKSMREEGNGKEKERSKKVLLSTEKFPS